MRIPLLLLASMFCLGLSAQSLTKLDFKGTEWFADNENRNFYESDSISLIRILKFNNEHDRLNQTYIKLQQNEQNDITELAIKNNGRLEVVDLKVDNWTNTKLDGKWKWKFDSKNQELSFYFKRKLHSSFRVISQETDHITWQFEQNKKQTKSKLDIEVLNLIRLEN